MTAAVLEQQRDLLPQAQERPAAVAYAGGLVVWEGLLDSRMINSVGISFLTGSRVFPPI